MTAAERKALDAVLANEGGYTDRPDDAGGPTNFGITLADLTAWRRRLCTADDVRALTREEAEDIYVARYIRAPKLDLIQDGPLFALLVDMGVLYGPEQAIRLLQRALGVTVDGDIGPETTGAVWRTPSLRSYLATCAQEVAFLGRIISGSTTDADSDGVPDHTEFAAGWLARAARHIEGALG